MGSSKKVVQRERRAFSAEFKAEAVRLVAARRADGASLTQIGRELEVRPDQLRAWTRLQREASGEGAAPAGETLEQENRRLRREVATLRTLARLALALDHDERAVAAALRGRGVHRRGRRWTAQDVRRALATMAYARLVPGWLRLGARDEVEAADGVMGGDAATGGDDAAFLGCPVCGLDESLVVCRGGPGRPHIAALLCAACEKPLTELWVVAGYIKAAP